MSERLYQLAETIGTSRTIPGTLGLWAVVVDAAPHNVKDMAESLMATMIKDTELEEAAYDEDFLLVRAVTTGRKYCEEKHLRRNKCNCIDIAGKCGILYFITTLRTNPFLCKDLKTALRLIFSEGESKHTLSLGTAYM